MFGSYELEEMKDAQSFYLIRPLLDELSREDGLPILNKDLAQEYWGRSLEYGVRYFFIKDEAGNAIAAASLTKIYDPTVHPYFRLNNLIVHKDYRGRGVGTFLIEKLEHIAKKDGGNCVVLEVHEDNERARKLYANLSYKTLCVRLIKMFEKREENAN